jgi:hypothetical protein
MKKRVIVYWLIPARPQRELLRELIRILAKQFDAPPFEPHLTLGRAEDRRPPRVALRRIKGAPIRMRAGELAFSSKFTKTLFLRFYSEPTLQKLIVDLGCGAKSLRDPHISLIYKKLPSAVKRELVATIKLPFRQVVFDTLEAVRCPSPTETPEDVESWKTLATRRLRE